MPDPHGATIIGTRMKTMLDMAAFANAISARYMEMNDNYLSPGGFGGHPSDVITPLLAPAEHMHANGREFITAIVLAYEIYLRFSDIFTNYGFDTSNFGCLATAVGTGKLLGLTRDQLSHSVAMAVVPNNILRQVRTGHMSMFKGAASGRQADGSICCPIGARRHGGSAPAVRG